MRQDNAELRLTPLGYRVGLIGEERFAAFNQRKAQIDAEIKRLSSTHLSPATANAFLTARGESPVPSGVSLADLLRRPNLTYEALCEIDPARPALPRRVRLTVEVSVKYDGYIKRELAEVERHRKLEIKRLPEDIDYLNLKGLRIEAAQKLDKLRPLTVGQASRISGVNPADISVLLIYLGLK